MMTILIALLATIVVVSVLIGRLAKLSAKELVAQTACMTVAGLILFGLVAML